MKELLLIRHAKSDWGDPGLDDHDRPLNRRGLRDAPRMGKALAERKISPDLIVTSSANRARTTASLVAAELGYEESLIKVESGLYLAHPEEILQVIQGIDESVGCVLLFGHNPGMHEAAWQMTRPGSPASADHFPTCAVARFQISAEFWGTVAFGEGELVDHLYPKGL